MLSKQYKYWKSVIDLKRCKQCKSSHGKIYQINENVNPSPPIHFNCRCIISILEAVTAGHATNNGLNGADYWLQKFGKLPPYYISENDALKLGWRNWLGNLSAIAPGKMLTKGVYKNRDGHLPETQGRIWYEADINYTGGFRGTARILFSNDGLIFVTYDHYYTFSEIV